MKNDLEIDWLAISQQGASNRAVDRLQRVINFFDQLNVTAKSEQPDKYWCDLEVHEPIASGSFGTLYRAYDPHLRREVALKLLAQDTPGASDWLEEARRLARVRHPGVIAILGASSDDRHAGIWMELSNGESLESLLTSSGIYPLNQTLETGIAIAEALEAVHERGLVHGDLKAGNVLIEPSGRVLLLDFGAATAQGEPANQASPRTAAPEQLTGQKADPAADIWSLGVLLYRCLSGQQPYTASDLDALLTAQRRPPELSALLRPFRSLISEMLSFDPNQRPSAEQVADRLRWIRDAPNRRRKNLAFGGIAASLLVGVTVASIGWYDAAKSNQREQLAAAQAQRSAEETRASMHLFQEIIGASFQGRHGRDARVIDVMEQAQRQIALDETQPPYVRAMLKYFVGASYLHLERIDEGMQLLDESVALSEVDDVNIALVRVSQGFHICSEDSELAETYATEIRRIATGRLPTDHHVLAAALKIEACVAQRRGDGALAERKLREAMALRPFSQFLDRGALGAAGRLAAVLIDQRRITEALPLLEETYSNAVELLGLQHDFTLGLANTYSQALLESSRFTEAVELLEQTLPAIAARSGVESTQWLATANTLALALGQTGNPARALVVSQRALEVSERLLGPPHQLTLAIRSNIPIQYLELGQLEKAEAAIEDAIIATEQAVGPAHPSTLINYINRVKVLTLMDRNSEAVDLGRSSLDIAVEALGPDHGISVAAQAYLARALASTGATAEAESLFTRALVVYERDNPDSIDTFETRYHFATMLADEGKHNQASAQLDALQRAFEHLPTDHPLLSKITALRQRSL